MEILITPSCHAVTVMGHHTNSWQNKGLHTVHKPCKRTHTLIEESYIYEQVYWINVVKGAFIRITRMEGLL